MITKGEWKVYESPFAPAVIIDRPRRLIATCHLEVGSEGMAEATANAHLIAAAPDMYEALKQIQKWLLVDGELDRKDLYNQQFIKANDLTAKAIAKAEGVK